MVFEFYLDAYFYLMKNGHGEAKGRIEKVGWKQWKVTLPGDNK
jgi:hypothetical protein